jgi:hypothetical protein
VTEAMGSHGGARVFISVLIRLYLKLTGKDDQCVCVCQRGHVLHELVGQNFQFVTRTRFFLSECPTGTVPRGRSCLLLDEVSLLATRNVTLIVQVYMKMGARSSSPILSAEVE